MCDGFDHTATCEVGTIPVLSLQLRKQAHGGSQVTAPRSQAGPAALAVPTVAKSSSREGDGGARAAGAGGVGRGSI